MSRTPFIFWRRGWALVQLPLLGLTVLVISVLEIFSWSAKPQFMVWLFNKYRTDRDPQSLLRVLSRCRELVARSDDSDWSCMDVPGILNSLDAGLSAVTAGSKLDVAELTLLFLPTGPLQETSISNDWSDEFLSLSTEFDQLIAKW